jgi:flagellar protein FliO/FliZ
MKALKYIIVPVVVFSGLIGSVYAGTPAYIRSSVFSALGDSVESFFRTIYYLFMFALILAAAYYITKFLARKGMAQNKSKTMKLMESMPLGADRSIHLIQVGTQYFLIGCASKGMILISELDQDKLFEEQPNSAININDFNYESFDEGFKGKDFGTQINSVKNNLKKLKSMVRGNNDDESK